MNCDNKKINQGLKDINKKNKKESSLSYYDSVKTTDQEVVRVNPYFLFYARNLNTVSVTKRFLSVLNLPQ